MEHFCSKISASTIFIRIIVLYCESETALDILIFMFIILMGFNQVGITGIFISQKNVK